MKRKFAVLVGVVVVSAVLAQSTKSDDEAVLYKVEKGVFKLSEGGTIDLTDHHWLLAFQEFHARNDCAVIAINGRKRCMTAGMRIDFKRGGAFYNVVKDVSDRDECFLDIVKLVSAKGAKPIATFRFHCI